MSSLSAKDRVSLCMFSFADGRRCRTPRNRNHPHFCFGHAQKEARALATDSLGKDLSYFFSGNYLSACDLSTAMARLIPAVLRGEVKPRVARTVAYMMQTLLQSIHISQHEYAEAFGGDGWRKAIRNSVNHNLDYRFPPAPKPKQPAPSTSRETLRNNPSAPTTGAINVGAGRNSSRPGRQPGSSPANLSASPTPQPAPPVNCHSDAVAQAFRPEEPAFSSSPAHPPTQAPQPAPSPQPAQTSPSCHPERSEGSLPSPATPSTPSAAATPQPAAPDQTRKVNPREPDRSAPWLNWSRTIPPDSKLL